MWCENEGRCGGCFYQGTPYEEQLAIKEREIRELLRSAALGEYRFENILPSPKESAYRNKMEFSFGDQEKGGPLCLGLHQKRSFFNILNTDDCRLPDPDFGVLLRLTREYFASLSIDYYHKKSHRGYLRHLLIRRTIKTGEILVDLVSSSDFPKGFPKGAEPAPSPGTVPSIREGAVGSPERRAVKEGGNGASDTTEREMLLDWSALLLRAEEEGKLRGRIRGILHTRNDALSDAVIDEGTEILWGEDFICEELLGLRFRISPFSFFQTNSLGAERLYSKIRDYAALSLPAGGEERKPVIYDLYSGTGTITQLMSPAASLSIGIELVPEAVRAARENARDNGITNCAFLAGDVLKVISEGGELIREDGSRYPAPRPDLIILDPPRDGIHPKALRKIIAYASPALIYVACKPKSFARDLLPLQEAGYRLQSCCPVDMFPQTNNCELVTLLSKDMPLL
ncbi:class I SAM-dependent RNA methyltransferase [Oribacterium sp. oral taxon 078]|uniref:class I SAM-dependent RNA methyltransferase n=1 Tax=Oribacterium sp. oral taxon 078 TaxID=652706 RepID=UPI00055AF0CC|nr:methyltransferase domain-containing protein [Oribacterium sp. oral taxon 078]